MVSRSISARNSRVLPKIRKGKQAIQFALLRVSLSLPGGDGRERLQYIVSKYSRPATPDAKKVFDHFDDDNFLDTGDTGCNRISESRSRIALQ